MRKFFKTFFLNETSKFLENRFSYIFEMVVICVMVSFILSVPLFTYNYLSYIPTILGGLFSALSLVWLFCFKKITLNLTAFCVMGFLFSIAISSALDSFQNIYRTIFVLPILFFSFYEFLTNGNRIKLALISFGTAIVVFSCVYVIHYWNELISLDFERLGQDFASNVNQVGSMFSYGFALFSYYLIMKKRWLAAIPMIIILGLGFSTGSKSFLVCSLLCIISEVVFLFGYKKWYLSLIVIGLIIGFGFIIIQLDVFESIQERVYGMINFIFTGTPSADYSTYERLNMAKEAFYLFLKKPFFGWGMQGVSRFGSYGTYSHNTMTEILANFGLFAFAFFEIPVFNLIFTLIKPNKTDIGKYGIPLVFACTMIFQQLTGVKFESKEFYLALAISLAIIDGKKDYSYINLKLVTSWVNAKRH